MGILGTLVKKRKAEETCLTWNLPGLVGPQTLTLTLTSEAFRDGETIPVEYAGKRAGGRNVSPQLAWSAAPSGTASQLLVVEDVDAPTPRRFVHCLADAAMPEAAQADRARPRILLSSVPGPALSRGRLTGIFER